MLFLARSVHFWLYEIFLSIYDLLNICKKTLKKINEQLQQISYTQKEINIWTILMHFGSTFLIFQNLEIYFQIAFWNFKALIAPKLYGKI